MKTIAFAFSYRLTSESLDVRVGQLACYFGAVAILPAAVVALVKNPGSQADFLLGLGLAFMVALLCAMLGTLCRRVGRMKDRFAVWLRWPEFTSYGASVGVLIVGIRSLAGLNLSPAQITLGLLLICALSLAVLVLGMMTTLVRSHKGLYLCDPWE